MSDLLISFFGLSIDISKVLTVLPPMDMSLCNVCGRVNVPL